MIARLQDCTHGQENMLGTPKTCSGSFPESRMEYTAWKNFSSPQENDLSSEILHKQWKNDLPSLRRENAINIGTDPRSQEKMQTKRFSQSNWKIDVHYVGWPLKYFALRNELITGLLKYQVRISSLILYSR